MTENNDPWANLADSLGAAPGGEPSQKPQHRPVKPSKPAEADKPANEAPAAETSQTDWGGVADQLGIESSAPASPKPTRESTPRRAEPAPQPPQAERPPVDDGFGAGLLDDGGVAPHVHRDHPDGQTIGQDGLLVLLGRMMTSGRQRLPETIVARKAVTKIVTKIVTKLVTTSVIKQPMNRVSQGVAVEGDVEAVAVAGEMIAAPKKKLGPMITKNCPAMAGTLMGSGPNGKVRLLRRLRMFGRKLQEKMDLGKG